MSSRHQPAHPLVVILGPTAVGKTAVGVVVAKALKTEVLTADSRQVYRGMDIGTEKPTMDERQGVPHRLVDLVDPDQPFNAGSYRRYALEEIQRVQAQGMLPLMVGGTGLYIRVVIGGIWNGPSADWDLRNKLTAEAEKRGVQFLYRELIRVDPDLAARIHPHDTPKIIRGLEVFQLVGRPLSHIQRDHGFRDHPFSPLLIGLFRERRALYERIEVRIDAEIQRGLLDETRGLLQRGYGRELSSMKGLGYRQVAGHLCGDYGLDEAVRRLKRDTRRFAKRQLTWFRREPLVQWVTVGETDTSETVGLRILEMIGRYRTELTEGAQTSYIPE